MSENGKLSRFWVQELTRPAFEDWLEHEPAPVVIVGIGAIEQHGTHLPLGTDSLGVARFIHDVASRTNSVCIHPCWPGYSPHHMAFPGTVTFSAETLLNILLDTIESFAQHGVKRIVLINYHGGNDNIMKLAAQIAKREYRVMVATPHGPSSTETAKKIQDRMKRYFEVHSGPRETAFALHYFPELVEKWRLDDWENGVVISEQLQEYMNPDREDYELVSQVFNACLGPNTEDITRTGQYATSDPRKADVKEAATMAEEATQFLVDFIKLWKTIPVPECYVD
ncbi:MAG: creatininase family protein [Candidatus Bathyarchaeota archaeon]